MTPSGIFRVTCKQATALAQRKSEKKISLTERLGLFVHLSYCSLCRLFFSQSELILHEASVLGQAGQGKKSAPPLTASGKMKIQLALTVKMRESGDQN